MDPVDRRLTHPTSVGGLPLRLISEVECFDHASSLVRQDGVQQQMPLYVVVGIPRNAKIFGACGGANVLS